MAHCSQFCALYGFTDGVRELREFTGAPVATVCHVSTPSPTHMHLCLLLCVVLRYMFLCSVLPLLPALAYLLPSPSPYVGATVSACSPTVPSL